MVLFSITSSNPKIWDWDHNPEHSGFTQLPIDPAANLGFDVPVKLIPQVIQSRELAQVSTYSALSDGPDDVVAFKLNGSTVLETQARHGETQVADSSLGGVFAGWGAIVTSVNDANRSGIDLQRAQV